MDRTTGIFVDGMGAAAATSGILNQLQGRIFALLYLQPRPIALEDIAAELEQSKSNVSVNIRGGPRVRRRALQRMAAARLPPEDRPELRGLSMNFPPCSSPDPSASSAPVFTVLAGEALVVRRLSPAGLPSSPFGDEGRLE